MPKKNDVLSALKQFERISASMAKEGLPSVSLLSFEGQSAFQILVATLISARTRDETTLAASRRFAKEFPDSSALACAPLERVSEIIYPVAFFRQKAIHLVELGRMLQDNFGGLVPSKLSDLLTLPGVGIKTANLVRGLAFGEPAICVDTHVHRIANRIGWITTKDVIQTESELKKLFPENVWISLNTVLVGFGQKTCTPQSPFCSRCILGQGDECSRDGVQSRR